MSELAPRQPPRRHLSPSPADPGYEGVDPFPSGDVPVPAPPPRAKPRTLASDLVARALVGVNAAVTPVRSPIRRPGVGDLLGFSAFRGLARSGTSMVTLAIVFLFFFAALRGILAVGTWVVVIVLWMGIGAVFYRNRGRIRWERLALLFRRQRPPADPN